MLKITFNNFKNQFQQNRKEYLRISEKVLGSGWYILGQEVKNFETKFADYLKVKHVIGVGNGLEALQISMMALGIGTNDEVITTPVSAVATTLAILAVKAKPVFVDTDENGLINSSLIEAKITKKTKAILAVHLYGNSVDIDKIQHIVKKNRLFLLEDACQAHGASYKNKKLGTFGILNSFSFYPTKNLGAFGDGGAITTNNSKLAKMCREIRDYGQADKYIHTNVGLNSRLDEIQAAFLSFKLKKLDENNRLRQQIYNRYQQNLQNSCNFIKVTKFTNPNHHLIVIKLKKRDQLQQYLLDQGVETLIHYPLIIPDQPFLKSEYKNHNLYTASRFCKEILSLPCYPGLKNTEIDYICNKIKSFLKY